MTQKEKTKVYDKFVEELKSKFKDFQVIIYNKNDLEKFFPELNESEDEKIKREIITYLSTAEDKEFIPYESWISWLEKQGTSKKDATREKVAEYLKNLILDQSQRGFPMLNYEGRIEEEVDFIISIAKKELKQDEQKYANKVKFKVGDWVVENGVNRNPVQITSFEEDKGVGIKVWFSNGTGTWVDYLKGYHKWTIEDARDGDVLAEDPIKSYSFPFVAIYKEQNKEEFNSYCFNGFDGNFYEGEVGHCSENIHPATKEQRDLLFKKMKEEGYEWDTEKKELKKIEQKPAAWSGEDNTYYDDICEILINLIHSETAKINKDVVQKDLDWLMSIQQRIETK